MRHSAVVVLAIACGPPKTPRDPRPSVKSPVASPVAHAPAAGPVPTIHKPRAVVEAPHGGAIQVLAATPDASAVLTIDELGGARLWPVLDGTREPRLVELPMAKHLALGKHADGFTAVVLDEVGGLYIAKLDGDGRTRSHTTHGVDPPVAGVLMTALGALAWRTDHHVLLIDSDGVIKDRLAAPEQRVVDIAAAGTRALAILDRAGTLQARWLVLEPRLTWGDWVPLNEVGKVGTRIALAPDHRHFATVVDVDRRRQVTIAEAATGKLVATREFHTMDVGVRFADANLLAVTASHGLSWMPVAPQPPGQQPTPTVLPFNRQGEMLAAGGGRVIWPSHGELMLMTPTDTQFLGYESLSPRLAQPAPQGQLLVSTLDGVHLLDADLRQIVKPAFGLPSGAQVAELQWLGGDHWLVESAAKGKVQLAIVDAGKGTSTVVRDALPETHLLAYEPSTQLATLSFGTAAEVARVDLKGRTLDRVASVAKPTPYEQHLFVPVAPSLARGVQLLHITMRDKHTIRWLTDPRALDKPAASVTLDGAYAGADAAGRVYAWRATPGGKLELGVYTHGKHTATLPTTGPTLLWPDPTGARIVEVAQGSVTLYQPVGTTVWARELSGVQEVLWLTDGAIAITHATGVARLDSTTGKVTAARCGWGFGLSTKPHPLTPRIEPVCSQLAR